MSFNELRYLIPSIVKSSVNRNQPLWGTADSNYVTENAPAWWPAQVPYCNPCKKPKDVTGWTDQLRSAAKACYQYHDKLHLTGDSQVEPQQCNDTLPGENVPPVFPTPALEQIIQHYSTLNESDMNTLNMQSTPELPDPHMSLSAILDHESICTAASLSFDQPLFQLPHISQLLPLSPDPPTTHTSQQPHTSPDPPATHTSQQPHTSPDPPATHTSQHPHTSPDPPATHTTQQPHTSPDPPATHTTQQPHTSPDPPTTTTQLVRRSLRPPKRTLKAEEYANRRTRQKK
ncbi:uncharacterized protein LOC144450923 [Glandiceps talaboti]